MGQKDIADISVTELAQEADVNRKTFYSHYSSVYDVLDEIEDDLASRMTRIIQETDFTRRDWNLSPVFKHFTELINEDAALFRYLFDENNQSHLFQKVRIVLKQKIMDDTASRSQLSAENLNYVSEFIASGTLSAYRSWLGGTQKTSLESVSETIRDLAFEGYNRFVTEAPKKSMPEQGNGTLSSMRKKATAKAKEVVDKLQQTQGKTTTQS